MGDAIDKRNLQDQIARSIIKRQFVHFLTPQEIEELQRQRAEKEALLAEEAARSQHEEDLKTGFNRKTNSYSGTYGKNRDMDELTKGQIEKILGEKEDAFRHVLDEGAR